MPCGCRTQPQRRNQHHQEPKTQHCRLPLFSEQSSAPFGLSRKISLRRSQCRHGSHCPKSQSPLSVCADPNHPKNTRAGRQICFQSKQHQAVRPHPQFDCTPPDRRVWPGQVSPSCPTSSCSRPVFFPHRTKVELDHWSIKLSVIGQGIFICRFPDRRWNSRHHPLFRNTIRSTRPINLSLLRNGDTLTQNCSHSRKLTQRKILRLQRKHL